MSHSWEAIFGSFSAGFGLGLTFDRTSRTQPNGWYKDMSVTADEFYRKFRVPKGMFGAAATHFADLGSWNMESTVFASSDRYDLYQYDMGMTGGEAVDWSEVDTDSPRIYIDGQRVGTSRLDPGWTTYSRTVLYATHDVTEAILGATAARQGVDVTVESIDLRWAIVNTKREDCRDETLVRR